MSEFPFSGRATLAWGDAPCACKAKPNPPDPFADAAAHVALYEVLGHAVAVGALADRLGMPDGARLVERVGAFVGTSSALGGAETGGVIGLVGKVGAKLSGSASRAWVKVEQSAARVWSAAASNPSALWRVGGLGVAALLGSQFLSARERVELEAIDLEVQLQRETLSRLSPSEAAAALRDLSAASSGDWFGSLGATVGTVGKVAAVGALALAAWWAFKAVR